MGTPLSWIRRGAEPRRENPREAITPFSFSLPRKIRRKAPIGVADIEAGDGTRIPRFPLLSIEENLATYDKTSGLRQCARSNVFIILT